MIVVRVWYEEVPLLSGDPGFHVSKVAETIKESRVLSEAYGNQKGNHVVVGDTVIITAVCLDLVVQDRRYTGARLKELALKRWGGKIGQIFVLGHYPGDAPDLRTVAQAINDGRFIAKGDLK